MTIKNQLVKNFGGFLSMNNRKNKGFSLIETLVAITVLLVAITGPLTIAHRALSVARISRDQTKAVYLAQDAIEYIKNVKDTNVLEGNEWRTGLLACINDCYIDSIQGKITPCSAYEGCPVLRYDSSKGLYGYNDDWQETSFVRTVMVTNLNDNESSISVQINWSTGTLDHSLSSVASILNWNQ